MFQLSRKSLLALEATLDVAIHARPNPVQARDITARQGVPARYLEQVMQALVRAKILRSVRGPNGGYRLARERRNITLADITRAVEPQHGQSAQQSKSAQQGKGAQQTSFSKFGAAQLAPLCAQLQDTMLKELTRYTLADLCAAQNPAQSPAPQRRQKPTDPDFTI